MRTEPRRRTRHVSRFGIILLLTAAVWLVVAMSEMRDYPLQLRVAMDGYDGNRYAVVEADSVVALQVRSNGFAAMTIGLRRRPVALQVDMGGAAVHRYRQAAPSGTEPLLCCAVAVDDLGDPVRQQLAHLGIRSFTASRDSLRLLLAPRASKTLPVDISTLQVSFADGYGLYGEPMVSPAEVTLYGPQRVLDRIDRLPLAVAAVAGLNATASHQLPLEPVWERYADVAVSASQVSVTIPVQPYVERSLSLPVLVSPADSTLRLRLYPDRATVRLWVARSDVHTVSPSAFNLTVDRADILAGRTPLVPRLDRFPDHVRVRSVEPAEIQYILIQ